MSIAMSVIEKQEMSAYGEIGRNVIHVHHLIPLSEIGEKYKVDSIEDLRPVCPNCHVMIHTRKHPYSIDEIKEMIKNNIFCC